jgi:hypothetical protein
MTRLVASSILVNVFVCSSKIMFPAACSPRPYQQKFLLVGWVHFLLYPADSGSLSGH